MIEVKPYREDVAEEWDNFVENKARNATFLHTRKFFNHNPINQEIDSSLIFLKNSNILCVIPAVLQRINGRNIWNSHAYATYGGFVVSGKLGVADALEIVGLTIENAKQKGFDELIVRNPFRIFNQVPSDETDYAMWHNGFQLLRRDVEITLSLNGYTPETLENLYNSKKRNAIRKAVKENVSVEITDDFPSFWEILSHNLAEKHSTKPTHSLEEFEVLRKLVGDEKIKFFGSYLNRELIAGMVVFIANKRVVHSQYTAGLDEFQHLKPINLLIHRISVWALENDFQYFNLGMSTNPNGGGVNLGLCNFKEDFGGRSVLRETMRLILNQNE